MIKKENRLSGKRQVGRVLQRGLFIKTPNLSCRLIATGGADKVRITVVVSKKVASRAVDRNLIKRRTREAFEEVIQHKKSASVVVFPRATAKELSFEELKREATICLEKASSS